MTVIQPLGDKVVIKLSETEEQQYGNIVVPDLGKEKMKQGKVVAVGRGRISEYGKFIATTVVVGDTVVVPLFGAQNLYVGGEEYVVCRENEIHVTLLEVTEPETEKTNDK